LDYLPECNGTAKFVVDIRDSNTSKILWSTLLDDPDGQSRIRTVFLPNEMSNKLAKIRLRVMPQSEGDHMLTVKNMRIT